MSVGVEDTILMEDMAGGDEAAEQVFKADFFAFGKVSSGHYVGEAYRESGKT